jgi:hypothetical protein
MPTGTINLMFDTPDISLTGTGEFDISDTFKRLFADNPVIKEEISNKIAEIFKNIDTKDIATTWKNKIKKAFALEEGSIDLQKDIEKKVKDIISNLRVDASGISVAAKPTEKKTEAKAAGSNIDMPNIKNYQAYVNFFAINKDFHNFVTFFAKNTMFHNFMKNFSTDISKLVKGVNIASTNAEGETSLWDRVLDVIVTDFSNEALNKLGNFFGKGSEFKKANKGKQEGESSVEGGWFKNMIGKLLPLLGLGALPALLKGFVGPALLAAGLLWMAWDGIKGWLGAEEWGVSKIAGAIGAALGGFSEGGLDNAIKNAGKGALVGAGLGMFGGPVGIIVGALVGAAVGGILGWIGGKDIAEVTDTVSKNISKWWAKNKDQYIGENVFIRSLHATGTFSLGKEEEDSTREIRHGLFNALILSPLNIWAKGAEKKATTKVAASLGAEFGTEAVEAMTIKGLRKIGAKGALMLGIKRFAKYIPGVSVLIGIGEAWDYFSQENYVSGLIALASGIAGVFPLAGTGISIMLDAINIGLTGTETGKKVLKSANNWWKGPMLEFLKHVPGIGTFIYLSEAIGAFSAGDWKTGLTKLNAAGMVGTGIGLFFEPEKAVTMVTEKLDSILPMLKDKWNLAIDKIYENFTKLFDWFGNLGIDIGEKLYGAWDKTKNFFGGNNEKTVTPIKTEALITEPKIVRYQPANEDKLYKKGDSDVYAKPDDILGKTFQNIEKQLTNLNNAFSKSINVLNNHSKLFADMLNVNQEQLKLLPSLIPVQESYDKVIPSSDIRDPAYEYRAKIYERIERGV